MKVVERFNSVYFGDLFRNENIYRSEMKVRFFRLESGDLLMMVALAVKWNQKLVRKVHIREEDLKVLSTSQIEITDGTDNFDYCTDFALQKINDLFVFTSIRVPGGLSTTDYPSYSKTLEEGSFLTLTNLDLEILHQSTELKVKSTNAIGMVCSSSNRVISKGVSEGEIYLHEIDQSSERLILVKKVVLQGGEMVSGLDWYPNPFSFCVQGLVREFRPNNDDFEEGGSSFVFLNFDKNLRLISYLKAEIGVESVKNIFPISSSKAVAYSTFSSSSDADLMIDFQEKQIRGLHLMKNHFLNRIADCYGGECCHVVEISEKGIQLMRFS